MYLSNITKDALSSLQSVALLQAHPEQLTEVVRQMKVLVKNLSALDEVRHSAHGIVSLYENSPAIEAIDFKVTRFIDSVAEHSYECEFENVQVRPRSYESEKDIECYTAALQEVYMESPREIPGSEEIPLTRLFSDEPDSLFGSAILSQRDPSDNVVTITTTRDQVVDALGDDGDIDALAATLFPQRWMELVKTLGVHDYCSQDNQSETFQRPRP